MKKILISISVLYFFGCKQQPSVGQWYQHAGTEEKIKILFIGKGVLANHYCQNCVAEMWKNVPEEKLARASYFISYSDSDSMKECFVWNESTNPFHHRYVVCAEEDFNNYILIE